MVSTQAAWAQRVPMDGLALLGGGAEDAVRRAQLLGEQDTEGFLFRSPSTLAARMAEAGSPAPVTLLLPDVRVVWNSGLPFSMNDGALWAGRGTNARVTAGLRLAAGRVTVTLAPHILYSENRDFPWIPYPANEDPSRSPFAHPFHPFPESLDHPLRFGSEAITQVGLGQSSVQVELGGVELGAGTENWWWGPGLRNAILLSNQAAGFPHVTAASSRPLSTGLGDLEGRWMLGWLSESDYFDLDPDNDRRTLSALGVTFRPGFDRNLTVGIARMVVAPLGPGDLGLGAGLDALKSVGRPNASVPDSAAAGESGPDQIFSVFGRWVFPKAGFEAYGEWARFEQPKSLRDMLEFPQHSQGYTYGVQWLDPREGPARTRVQVELTTLEPSSTWRHRRVFGSYTSSAVAQGFTQKGQVLGAAIGPSASSQWASVDRIWTSGVRVGVFAGRVRPDAAAQFTDVVPAPKRQDVLLFWGIRGGTVVGGWDVSGELSPSVRLNYLFQTYLPDPVTGRAEGIDVANTSLTLSISRAVRR